MLKIEVCIDLSREKTTQGSLRVFWKTAKQFERIANILGMMNDLKAGLPRSSFEGIVRVFTVKKVPLFVVPEKIKSDATTTTSASTTAAKTTKRSEGEQQAEEEEEGEVEEEEANEQAKET